VAELPELSKGKGNKIINIATAKAASREELLTSLVVFDAQDTLLVHSGKQHLRLKPADIAHFVGERGRRGNKLPRGYQRVDYIETVPVDNKEDEQA
jgi:topoisomerase-4 subunit A